MSAEGKLTKQVSVFLENKSGRLADVCRTLGEHGINIRALCIADTSDFGILRLIVNRPDDATTILRDAGFSVGETNVIAVQIPDVPGGLGMALALLEGAGVNVEYMYAFFTRIDAMWSFFSAWQTTRRTRPSKSSRPPAAPPCPRSTCTRCSLKPAQGELMPKNSDTPLFHAPQAAREVVADLVERYRRNADNYASSAYNETQVRREFIDPFFEALGRDIANREGLSERFKDVVHEGELAHRRTGEGPH